MSLVINDVHCDDINNRIKSLNLISLHDINSNIESIDLLQHNNNDDLTETYCIVCNKLLNELNRYDKSILMNQNYTNLSQVLY